MEISEIKKKIMEKIEGGKSKTSRKKKRLSLSALSKKMGKPEEEVLKIFNKALAQDPTSTASPEKYTTEEKDVGSNDKLAGLASENASLKNQMGEKDRAIAELQKKFVDESTGVVKESEKEKTLLSAAFKKTLAIYKQKIESLEGEISDLKNTHDNTVRQNEGVLASIEEKNSEINDLKEKLRNPALESENKKVKKLHEDSLRQNDALLVRIEEKDKEIRDLQKKLEESLEHGKKIKDHERAAEEHRAEKEKAVSNMEGLRSKLYAATKEVKEQAGRIGQLEDTVKHRDKKLADSEKAFKNIEKDRAEVAMKLQASEETAKSLQGRVKELTLESEAKDKKIADAEKICNKNIESAKKEMNLEMQAVERSRKALEGKIAQLNIELEAKDRRVKETENANMELDNLVKESSLKLQAAESAKSDTEEKVRHIESALEKAARDLEAEKAAGEDRMAELKAEVEALKNAIKEKEKSEEELNENIQRLENEIESRDKKIQTDIKYCEEISREVNDLRQKIKAYRLKVK